MDDLGELLSRIKRPRAKHSNQWYRIVVNAAKDDEPETADVYIYDEISAWGVTASNFAKDLAQISAKDITVRMNTPGGDVYDGIAIHSVLKNHPANVTVKVEGLAASIGSVIAMAGDKIIMSKYATMMIHDAMGAVFGNAEDHTTASEVLNKISTTLAQIYADRAGGDVEEWRAMMLAETWFDSKEAVEFGLADAIDDKMTKVENSWDLGQFRHPGRERAPDPHRYTPSPALNVLVPPRETAPENSDPPGEGGEWGLAPETFARVMDYAVNPPVPTDEVPFEFDHAVFAVMLRDRTKSAPAIVLEPPKNTVDPDDAFDPAVLRSAIIERRVRT